MGSGMCVAGIDAGMETTKAVVLQEDRTMTWAVVPGGTEPTAKLTEQALAEALEKAGLPRGQLGRLAVTGDCRDFVGVDAEKLHANVCLAKGCDFLMPAVRTVVDLGARQSTGIRCRGGRPFKYFAVGKCANGTGASLGVFADFLGVDLSTFGEMYFASTRAVDIQSRCAIFAESEIISLIHSGVQAADIVAGAVRGLAGQVLTRLTQMGVEPDVALVGGVARNKALVSALQDALGLPVHVPEEPRIVGALGAALSALESAGASR